MSETVELIDIYDENRNKTGLVLPRGTFLEPGRFQIYALAILQNADGRYLITQRSMNESWGAGWWEVPGGGVLAGETPQVSIVREIGEEVGLDISDAPMELAYTYTNIDPKRGHNYFTDIYLVHVDFAPEDVHLQEEEAVDFRLVTWEDIRALGEAGIFLHYNRIAAALGQSIEA